jgi:predicted enzyme related to lactoylglutathione lyase
MTLHLANITVDCHDAARLAAFWAEALGRPVDDGASEFMASLARDDASTPTWLFLRVAEGKAGKNRMHVDFRADDYEAETARLVALGATRTGHHDEYGVVWNVLTDPEGNEFCVGQPSA